MYYSKNEWTCGRFYRKNNCSDKRGGVTQTKKIKFCLRAIHVCTFMDLRFTNNLWLKEEKGEYLLRSLFESMFDYIDNKFFDWFLNKIRLNYTALPSSISYSLNTCVFRYYYKNLSFAQYPDHCARKLRSTFPNPTSFYHRVLIERWGGAITRITIRLCIKNRQCRAHYGWPELVVAFCKNTRRFSKVQIQISIRWSKCFSYYTKK